MTMKVQSNSPNQGSQSMQWKLFPSRWTRKHELGITSLGPCIFIYFLEVKPTSERFQSWGKKHSKNEQHAGDFLDSKHCPDFNPSWPASRPFFIFNVCHHLMPCAFLGFLDVYLNPLKERERETFFCCLLLDSSTWNNSRLTGDPHYSFGMKNLWESSGLKPSLSWLRPLFFALHHFSQQVTLRVNR